MKIHSLLAIPQLQQHTEQAVHVSNEVSTSTIHQGAFIKTKKTDMQKTSVTVSSHIVRRENIQITESRSIL